MLAIPSGPLSLCDALRQLESHTWLELEAGVQVKQKLDEEPVTAYHLMRLARAVRGIAIEKHSRRREARTGADWEWWVGRPGSFLGFRVQAKIVNAASVEYSALYSSSTNPTKQVDKLIAAAEHAGRNTYPIYAFYNYWMPYSGGPTRWPCPRVATEPRSIGWTIASAYDIARHLGRWSRSKKARDLSNLMYPVSCPFCCKCSQSGKSHHAPLARRLADWLSERWGENPPQVVERAPRYVEQLYRRAASDAENLSPFGSRLERDTEVPNGVSRVMLVGDLDQDG